MTAKIDAALAKAQGEIEAATKDSINPHFRNKYAGLSSVWDACRAALSKHGVSVTQWPIHNDDGKVHLVTRLAHDGEWILGRISVPVSKPDAQGYGSAITYARRYGLSAAVGVVADDDDDGNSATNKPAAPQPNPTAKPAPSKKADPSFPYITKERAAESPDVREVFDAQARLSDFLGRDAYTAFIARLAASMTPPIPNGPYTGDIAQFRALLNAAEKDCAPT
jgi:hypothetical protein